MLRNFSFDLFAVGQWLALLPHSETAVVQIRAGFSVWSLDVLPSEDVRLFWALWIPRTVQKRALQVQVLTVNGNRFSSDSPGLIDWISWKKRSETHSSELKLNSDEYVHVVTLVGTLKKHMNNFAETKSFLVLDYLHTYQEIGSCSLDGSCRCQLLV